MVCMRYSEARTQPTGPVLGGGQLPFFFLPPFFLPSFLPPFFFFAIRVPPDIGRRTHLPEQSWPAWMGSSDVRLTCGSILQSMTKDTRGIGWCQRLTVAIPVGAVPLLALS